MRMETMSQIDQIIAYFLNLFKLQCRDPDIEDKACGFVPVTSDSSLEPVYDLFVKCGGTVKTRRMSIRQLGEQVESKSTCHKVIFDDQMVIKIPPKPILDFKKYLEHISNERSILIQLSPHIHCVSPSLSAILGKVPGVIDDRNLPLAALEEKCIRLLSSTPRLQTHLKIGEGFVFFMNLSKNAFFNQVIEQIHEEKIRVQKEIIKNAWLFDNLDTFETIYGEEQQDVFFSVKGIFKSYEETIDELMRTFKITDLVPEYKKKEWFFSILAHDFPDIDEKGLPDGFIPAAQKVFTQIMAANKPAVNKYRKTVKAFVRKKIFENNKKAIEGLSANILNLLYHLKNQSVAVRDLKPDNIYLSARDDGMSYQFWDHESYSLGLIDLETAVSLKTSDIESLGQPLLAGTPSYMTPSHIFKNSVLTSVFGSGIHRVFYMQDWFAVLSMIYNVVTGKMLFARTAKLIPQILKMKKKALFYHKPMTKVFKRVSIGFWEMAEEEFNAKLNAESEKFSIIHISLPKPIAHLFQGELAHEKSALVATIEKYVTSNTLFADIGPELVSMSLHELSQYRVLWEKGILGSVSDDGDRKQLDLSLKILEKLKHHVESHEQIRAMLAKTISCHDIMVYLFNRVMLAMYRHPWLIKAPSGLQAAGFSSPTDPFFQERKP
jgi:serine/threonine protein kinase